MTGRTTPDALEALIDGVLHKPNATSGPNGKQETPTTTASALDAGTVQLVRDLRALATAAPLRDGFIGELEAALLRGDTAVGASGNGIARQRPTALAPRRRLLLASAAVVTLAVVGTTLWRSPMAQAQVARLASFVPGLGIRSYDPRGLVAPKPVSVSQGGATMTVQSLLSNGDTTTIQVAVTGLAATPPLSSLLQESTADLIQLRLRDANGREYPPAPGYGSMRSGGGGPRPFFRTEMTFVGLDPSVRAVDVLLDAPPPIGSWNVRVPVESPAQAGLAIAQPEASSVTLHGITVQVASVAANSQHTVVQLIGQAAPPIRYVRSLGRGGFPSQRVLIDDHGRSYKEVPGPGRTFPDAGGHYTDDVQFPPLPADIRSATLVVPFVIVEETGEATVHVPVAGKQVGDHIPLNRTMTLDGFPVHISEAAIIEEFGERRLVIYLDGGDWQNGRKLVAPQQVRVDGTGSAMRMRTDGDVGQASWVNVALPAASPDGTVTVTLSNPAVAVQGPWRLPVQVPRSR